MNRVALTALLPLLWAAPQIAQAAECMVGMVMPGCTPATAAKPKAASKPPLKPPTRAAGEAARPKAPAGPTCMAGMVMPGCTPAPASGAAGSPSPGTDPHASHDMSSMPGMNASSSSAADPHAGHQMPATPAPADPHAGYDMSSMPGMNASPGSAPDPHAGHQMPATPAPANPHAGHAMPASPAAEPQAERGEAAMPDKQTGADLAVGDAPPPPTIRDSIADQVYNADAMRRSRIILASEHGGARVSKLQADILEWAPKDDRYSWQVEGWYGGDINRLAFKTEGEGQAGDGLESAEVQLLYSRAVARYTDLQAGVRYDVEPRGRGYATVGVDAMFPYWFEAEGALFLSDQGDLLARVEGSYDLRLTQRLVLQPRAELEFAAQDIPQSQIGSGLSRGEFGLRLRYEFKREFAPYIGISHERSFGDTADFVRAHGEKAASTRLVVGLRAWF